MPRTCGTCTACCHALAVEQIGKPAFRRCPSLKFAGGCEDYDARPDACRNFACLWLQGHMSEGDRPDLLGAIFTTTSEPQVGQHVLILEVIEGALASVRLQDAIDQLKSKTPVLTLTPGGGTFYPKCPQITPLTIAGEAA